MTAKKRGRAPAFSTRRNGHGRAVRAIMALLAGLLLGGVCRAGMPDSDFRRFLRDVKLGTPLDGTVRYLQSAGTDNFRGREFGLYQGQLGSLTLKVKLEPVSRHVVWMEVRCPGNRFDAWRPVVTSAVGASASQMQYFCDDTRSRSIVWRTTHKLMAEISLRDYTYFRLVDESFFERVYALCEPKPEEKPVIIIPRE
ncbi:MAG: hypothetical protein KA419_10955 [Acidobacteria bacterium]|nr:hypothetical protein [Acidobacteriota bacterium]